MSRAPRVCAILAAALVAATARAQTESQPADYKKTRLAEVTALIPRIEELIAWCSEAKLFHERDRLNALIITLDGEHEKARAALHFRRQRDGSWLRSNDWKEARNVSEKPLTDYAKRRANTVDPFVARLIPALEREKTAMAVAIRKAWVEELVEIAPDNAAVRLLTGEAKLKDKWVLVETVSAAERRAEHVSLAKVLRDAERTITDGAANDHESALPLKPTAIRQTQFVRVFATIPPPQVDKAVRVCDAAWQLTHKLLGADPAPGVQATVAFLRNDLDSKAYLATHPETPDPDRGKALFDYTLTKTRCVVVGYDLEAERTSIAIARLTHIATDNAIAGEVPPWAAEGMGMHVMQLLTNQRAPLFGRVNAAGALEAELRKSLWKADTKWLATAAALAKAGKAPKLERLMSVGLFKMNSLDSLFAAGFVAYLLEGRPADGATFIRISGRGIEPTAAVGEALGLPIADLEARFHRWLEETSALMPR